MIPSLALLDSDLAYLAGSQALSTLNRIVLAVEESRLRPVDPDANVHDDFPTDVLAVAFTEQTFQTLTTTPLGVGEKGGGSGEVRYLDVLRLDPKTDLESPLLKALVQRCTATIRQLVEQNVKLTMSTATIRREVETLQGNLVEAERVIRAFGPGERIVYTVFPTDENVTIAASAEAVARQLLPVRSFGVSSVDLFFRVPARAAASDGALIVSLQLLETKEVVGSWRVEVSSLATGWRSFKLKRAVAMQTGHLELSIHSTAASGGFALALGAPHPSRKAVFTGKDGLSRPLALRVGCFVPGLALDGGRESPEIDRTKDVSLVHRIGVAQFERCEVDGISEAEARTGMVTYYPDDSEFQVHPKIGTIVKAILRTALPGGTVRVVSQIRTRHEQAPAVQYGLMAVPSQRTRSSVLDAIASLNRPSNKFSGWVTGEPMRQRQVELHFETPLDIAHDLCLMTRPIGTTSHAWARFFDVWYEVQHPDVMSAR